MGYRHRLRRLESLARGDEVEIPQPSGPPGRFQTSDLEAAFKVNLRRLRGEDVQPHPLAVAAAKSPERRWREGFFGDQEGPAPEDLTELPIPSGVNGLRIAPVR
jgi:hypothetical protein